MQPPHKWAPVCPPPVGLVRPVRIDPTGYDGPTRGQARGDKWRRTSHGFYVPDWVDDSRPEQRIMEQSVRLPFSGAVTGWAGCRLHGANFFDGLLTDGQTKIPVPLAIGLGNIRRDDSISVSRDRLDPDEVRILHGIPCTVPARSLFDAMRWATGLREAAVNMDMMAAARVISIRRMTDYSQEHAGWQGVEQVGEALTLASERSRSPNETRVRLIWVLDAGLPPPLVNRPVFNLAGQLLGIADLLDVDAGVVGEFDGADHRSAHRHSSDVGREDGFRRHGLEVFRVTGPDIPHVSRVVDRMHGARSRAKWLPPAERRWTIEPPPWWRREPSLDELLDHNEVLASIYEEVARAGDPDIRSIRGW